jgi:hypothetical protein
LDENQNILENLETKIEKKEKADSYKAEIVCRNVILLANLHIFAVYGACIDIIVKYAKWQTMVFAYVIALLGWMRIQRGNIIHRNWGHRSFKAKLPLRLILAFLQTMTFKMIFTNGVVTIADIINFLKPMQIPISQREASIFSRQEKTMPTLGLMSKEMIIAFLIIKDQKLFWTDFK